MSVELRCAVNSDVDFRSRGSRVRVKKWRVSNLRESGKAKKLIAVENEVQRKRLYKPYVIFLNVLEFLYLEQYIYATRYI